MTGSCVRKNIPTNEPVRECWSRRARILIRFTGKIFVLIRVHPWLILFLALAEERGYRCMSLKSCPLNWAGTPNEELTISAYRPAAPRRIMARAASSIRPSANEAWKDPDICKMYFEAVKWVLGMTEGGNTPHPKPAN